MWPPRVPIATILSASRGCPPGLGDLARRRYLERSLPAELARLASAQVALREKAGTRLPPGVEWYLDSKGLAQATRWPVAQARAAEIDARLPRGARVWDATCGLGVDALALQGRERLLAASDRAPECARSAHFHLSQHAADPPVLVASALGDAVRARYVYVDPDRRSGGGRTLAAESFEPGWAAVLGAARTLDGLVCKLPPSFDPTAVERAWPKGLARAWRWTSHAGELCEVSLWTGDLAAPQPHLRSAECIDAAGGVHVLSGPHDPAAAAEVATRAEALQAAWLCEADPALTCSGLLGIFARSEGLALLGPRSGFLASARRIQAPFVRCWRVLEAGSADERVLRERLRRRDIGAVDVKVRGHALGANELARRLAGRGERRGLVAIARLAQGHAAFLLENEPPDDRDRGGADPILSRSP